ncbi:serine phosphatase RsbU (regulator of sigma subunit) [Algoriphagus iocasae]|uniref:Serine phosphatase RsbU (Regulator of sigma subunit) n=1 Tax=Algoriphagus iocasae TaxID=1836499 RepID=A0A841MDL6_9BACT|nr:GAF domain-containing SpoIIE family protein phosphatase [Algoriphagus iocasae]MBB6326152.1 serine phosphatase RsbU (regulator of sigma subunit) [Algoriphagus iocasae]
MIKLPSIHIGKLSMLLAILVWLSLLFVDLVRLFGILNELESGIAQEFTWILEILFFLTVYFFYNYSINKNSQTDFLNLIWRAASTGIVAVIVSIMINLFYSLLGDSNLINEPFLRNFFYHVNFALISIFLISSALLWKHLILYQKSKRVVKQWQAYEFAMLAAMFFIFFNNNSLDYSFLFGLVILVSLGIILSANLKWIPYLTFREKWKSLLFLFIIIICCGYLFYQVLLFSDRSKFIVNLTDNLFLVSLFSFIFIYALFCFLVTLFNLPTSSVFEQKLTEAINFQRLSQSIQPEESEEQVLDILVDSCMSASYADAAWLELGDQDSTKGILQERFLGKDLKEELSELIQNQKVAQDWAVENRPENLEPLAIRLNHNRFESILLVPLVINKSAIGRMVLCKEVRDGFNKEMINIISTFVRQACIAVENHRLLNQAIQNERYQEELKIAQRVQKSLLPTKLDHNDSFDICAYSNAADEVGGDYYDTYKLDDDRYVLIIGDVSGKGTSAAFNMSQMKGIFQSLIQLNLSPAQFMIKANAALSRCLERNHFITASIFLINTAQKTVCHARAGHVPTLMHQVLDKKSDYLGIDGLGLGILRNKQYENHVEEKTFSYSSGDVLVLFTDGIVEAKNEKSQQFGFERIRTLLEVYHELSPKEIQTKIIDSLHAYVGGDGLIDDDYSIMVIKFS